MNSTDLGIIDTHCHLWKIELASQAGLTKEIEPLFRSFGPTDLLQAAQTVGVQQFVLIEAGKTAEEKRVLEQVAASTAEITAIERLPCSFTPYSRTQPGEIHNGYD